MENEYEDEENEQYRRESMAGLFNHLLRVLPVDVSAFVEIASYSPALIFSESIAERLIVILLNEQDTRMSDKVRRAMTLQQQHLPTITHHCVDFVSLIQTEHQAASDRHSEDSHGGVAGISHADPLGSAEDSQMV